MGADPLTIALVGLSTLQQQQQMRQQQKAQVRAAQSQANVEAARLRHQQDVRNRQRREQLTRNLATQRARFGAAGVGGGGGSADAVLKGFQNEADRRIGEEEAGLSQRIGEFNTRIGNIKHNNLLERRNFLQQKVFNAAVHQLKTVSLLDQ